MREWEKVIPEEDRKVYENHGCVVSQEIGTNPALIIVDVTEAAINKDFGFIGSISRIASAEKAANNIKVLLDIFRSKNHKVVFVKGSVVDKYHCGPSTKVIESGEKIKNIYSQPMPEIIKPLESEYVYEKTKASAFFCSPLFSYLNKFNVDTLFIVGGTTSGCLRASVVDAFSLNYKVFVVEECAFERSDFSHLVNLFEINAKYADVITLERASQMLKFEC